MRRGGCTSTSGERVRQFSAWPWIASHGARSAFSSAASCCAREAFFAAAVAEGLDFSVDFSSLPFGDGVHGAPSFFATSLAVRTT